MLFKRKIFVQPTFGRVREEMGFEPWEEADGASLIFTRNCMEYSIKVEDGEIFEIPKDSIGYIDDDDCIYVWKTEACNDQFIDEFDDELQIVEELSYGRYRINGNVVAEIKDFEIY